MKVIIHHLKNICCCIFRKCFKIKLKQIIVLKRLIIIILILHKHIIFYIFFSNSKYNSL